MRNRTLTTGLMIFSLTFIPGASARAAGPIDISMISKGVPHQFWRGVMQGAITEDPIRIGYKAVEAAVKVLRGQKVPRTIDTGFHWYDRTNIDDPAIAVLLEQ